MTESPKITRIDRLGYIPFVGTVIGTGRIGCGVLLVAVAALSKISAIFAPKILTNNKLEFNFGVYEIVRGSVELVPFVGGLATKVYDGFRLLYETE